MIVEFCKIRSDVILPKYATDGSGALDVSAYLGGEDGASLVLWPGDRHAMPLGFKTSFNGEGYGILRISFLLVPRSGMGSNGLHLENVVGLIDGDFRGEWQAKLIHAGNSDSSPIVIHHGMRILQAIPVVSPRVFIEVVERLDETVRGEGGFGSTGV